MASEGHKLAIFRGLLKFKSNQQKILGVLIFLSINHHRGCIGNHKTWNFNGIFLENENFELDFYYPNNC